MRSSGRDSESEEEKDGSETTHKFIRVQKRMNRIGAKVQYNLGKHGADRGLNLRIVDWQIVAASDVLGGRDVMVCTATSIGKSMCYQAVAITEPNSVILPLLSLMEDQIKGCKDFGLTACALYKRSIHDNPSLLKEAAEGLYQVVLVGPEFMVSNNYHCKTLISHKPKKGKLTFRERVTLVVVDECHLCYTWFVLRFHENRKKC
ncbi:hypothetical protein BDZ91DRAFT_101742 [Kalaharituber pfeilii]|nr:hypothetical protein BDZ91DRAFT_101742 [Kalaharituber pfeilii]